MEKINKIILLLIGFISLGLGCIGVFIPFLPTVPFLLLTAFCFAKSSKRFHLWFINTKLYKKYLEDFARNHSITLSRELILLAGVSTILIISTILADNTAVSIILPIVILGKYLYFIFYVKTISNKQ